MYHKIRVYPVHGWSSYVITIYIPEHWDKRVFIKKWIEDNLIHVDDWKWEE